MDGDFWGGIGDLFRRYRSVGNLCSCPACRAHVGLELQRDAHTNNKGLGAFTSVIGLKGRRNASGRLPLQSPAEGPVQDSAAGRSATARGWQWHPTFRTTWSPYKIIRAGSLHFSS